MTTRVCEKIYFPIRQADNLARALFSVLIVSLLFQGHALADDFPFKDDSEMLKGFSDDAGISETEKSASEADRFKIGGTYWNELDYAVFSPSTTVSDFLMNPNNLWLYGDARLRRDIRGYVKGRLVFDPTADGTNLSPITDSARNKYEPSLDELKLMFNAGKTVFFTAGRQKIKWGSGFFWNPTDFLNLAKRDAFRSEDRRNGVTLFKTHVPVGSSNIYLVQDLEDASRPSHMGHAFRAEVALKSSEFALSFFSKTERKAQLGFNASFALFDLDVYIESSYSHGSDFTFYRTVDPTVYGVAFLPYREETKDFFRSVVGLSYEIKYSDRDTVTLALEYFHNPEGYSNSTEYAPVFTNGAYVPFYLGRSYGMFFVYLPAPGKLDDIIFSLYDLINFTDSSHYTRVGSDIKLIEDMRANLALGFHYGNASGEFRLGGQAFDLQAGLSIDF